MTRLPEHVREFYRREQNDMGEEVMELTPDTTLADIAGSETLQKQLIEMVLSNGARSAMWSNRLSYDRADAVASGIHRGVVNGLENLVSG